jgi:N4-(beta-N-acetylglucosaminyl)-L-asparaginase
MRLWILCSLVPLVAGSVVTAKASPGLPFVINTWGGEFTSATDAAYEALVSGSYLSALDAVETGCSTCERNQCDGTVGYGGSPDESCETTLDAMIMDGGSMNVGAVAGLRRVRDAISVARRVLDHTSHSLLVGDQATEFAVQNGFVEEDITTPDSRARCEQWKTLSNCQPNFRINVSPDPSSGCGPYTPLPPAGSGSVSGSVARRHDAQGIPMLPPSAMNPRSHDTISMIAISSSGAMAAGTSTNGASHKIPGRVGDGPIIGSGSYVDGEVGGCGATGDGDLMMRFLPCYQAVENLRRGMSPRQAAEDVVMRMSTKYPAISTGIVVVDANGLHGAAASGWTFTYSFRGGTMNQTHVIKVLPLN